MEQDVRRVVAALCRKGFVEDATRDHRYFFFYYEGKQVFHTKISHGAKVLGDSLIGMMSRQMFLSKVEFLQFIQCTLSEKDYVGILKEKGMIA